MPRVNDCSLEDFRSICETTTELGDYPLASAISGGVLVYETATLRQGPEADVRAELAQALSSGPGVARLVGAFEDKVVDRASAAFEAMIETQRRQGTAAGDHYAKPGDNDRVWNALEKLAIADPALFLDYYGNDMLAVASLAWLGPGYQVTSQVNVVNPGGAAQQPHRDYHLGFLADEIAEQYPLHVHTMSPLLTLQAVIAHVDMPAETGPTLVLPHSHRYELGYLAWRRPEFIEYFAANRVQPELTKGDLVVLNPAVFHAAGHNRTGDVRRMANLLQVSSAFGQAMESIDRYRMVRALYPELRRRWPGEDDRAPLLNALAAAAEGYAFPTNLDRDQPVDRLTPESTYELVVAALDADLEPAALDAELDTHFRRRLTS